MYGQSRSDFRSTEAHQIVWHQTEPCARLERPCCGGAADICDEFPSPHGFARAEDSVGYKKNITFWIENCAVRYIQAGRPHVRFGSRTDIPRTSVDVCFTLKSGHR